MAERAPRLEGKVAIITGAGSSGEGIGNGKAAAILMAREGARVLLVDQMEDRAKETLRIIESEGGEASTIAGDMTKLDDCERMAQAAIDRYGRVDILDNNVGISQRGTVVEVSEEDWDRVMTVNLKTMVLAAKVVIPRMMQTGGGSIINISSIAGLRAHMSTPYTASKAGVIGADHIDGGRPRPGQHSGERHRAGSGVHAHGGPADGRRPAAVPDELGADARGGHRLGHRLRGAVPGQRRGSVDHGHRAAGGRRAVRGASGDVFADEPADPVLGGLQLGEWPWSGPFQSH